MSLFNNLKNILGFPETENPVPRADIWYRNSVTVFRLSVSYSDKDGRNEKSVCFPFAGLLKNGVLKNLFSSDLKREFQAGFL